jgi:AcrR family transcriptional regulator
MTPPNGLPVKYAPQMATQQRSRVAILAGAKEVIASVGSYESLMNEIAERAEVSRATIYNHFSDREELMLALLTSEVERLITVARTASTKAEALLQLSRAISDDLALAKMVETDHDDIVAITTITGHPLWIEIHRAAAEIFGEDENTVGLILRWLIAQVTSPLTLAQSQVQAQRLASLL